MADATGRPPDSPRPPPTRVRLESIQRRPADRVELLGDYTEMVWSGRTGPTAVLLARRLSRLAQEFPSGLDVDLADMAAGMGVGERRVISALGRLIAYKLVERSGRGIAVSGYGPMLTPIQLNGSPASTVAAHLRLVATLET